MTFQVMEWSELLGDKKAGQKRCRHNRSRVRATNENQHLSIIARHKESTTAYQLFHGLDTAEETQFLRITVPRRLYKNKFSMVQITLTLEQESFRDSYSH
ncbi:hypothetical protein TNCV_74861 [Trichonephila clavipes]|nr:hypothetical protein TNCV_74861 [Trichonephila clavipes]